MLCLSVNVLCILHNLCPVWTAIFKLRWWLCATYSAGLRSLPRRFNPRSHLASGDHNRSHGGLGQGLSVLSPLSCFFLFCFFWLSRSLPAVSSVVGWRQCTKHVVQPVCGPLLLVFLLGRQPAEEKSDVTTYKELKWKQSVTNSQVLTQVTETRHCDTIRQPPTTQPW